jgi:hypothetical protein
MLKKIIAFVQLGVVRSKPTALVGRVTEFNTHAIRKTFRAGRAAPMNARKSQPVRKPE